MCFTAAPVRWAALRSNRSLLLILHHCYPLQQHFYCHLATITCCSSLLRKNRIVIAYYYICYFIIITYYYICYYIIITCCSCNNETIFTVIMGLLSTIFTRSLMGNNGFIITHYVPGQLADGVLVLGDLVGAADNTGRAWPQH